MKEKKPIPSTKVKIAIHTPTHSQTSHVRSEWPSCPHPNFSSRSENELSKKFRRPQQVQVKQVLTTSNTNKKSEKLSMKVIIHSLHRFGQLLTNFLKDDIPLDTNHLSNVQNVVHRHNQLVK